MVSLHPEFVKDEKKQTKSVVVSFSEWQEVVAELEELDDIRAFDKAKSSKDEVISFDQAVCEIRKGYDE